MMQLLGVIDQIRYVSVAHTPVVLLVVFWWCLFIKKCFSTIYSILIETPSF